MAIRSALVFASLIGAVGLSGCGKMPTNGATGSGGNAGGGAGAGGTAGGGTTGDTDGGTTTGTGGGADGGTTVAYQFTVFDGPGDHAGGTTVNGINGAGDVVGFSANMGATTLTNFVRKPDGTFTMLNLGGATAMANGINMNGEIVGVSGNNAIVDTNGTTTALKPTPGSQAEAAFGINDAGAIVGQYTAPDKTMPGFLQVNNVYTKVAPATAAATNAQGVNKKGVVIGFFATAAALAGKTVDGNPMQHGFAFDSAAATYTMLPDPKQPNLFTTQFLGINDNNQAVGYWQDVAGNQHGFIYDLAAKTFAFLDAPAAAPVKGVTTTQIVGINDNGEIAGFFVDAQGVQHGFVAKPQ